MQLLLMSVLRVPKLLRFLFRVIKSLIKSAPFEFILLSEMSNKPILLNACKEGCPFKTEMMLLKFSFFILALERPR
jgi:hypothetical protein